MALPPYDLEFGADTAASYTSEVEFLDALQRSKRPIRDASFKAKKSVVSKATSVRVGGLIVATGAGCPVHFETDSDPQYSLLIPTHGSGIIKQGSQTVRLKGGSVIRSSYHRPLEIDYSQYAGMTIRADISLLLNTLNFEGSTRERAMERLLDTDVEHLPMSIGSVDYYSAIRSVVRMIDAADCNVSQLERIGFHKLLTGLIADLTLKVDPRIRELVAH